MACTYDYQTGKIERDFHFVKVGEKCKLSGLPAKAGNERCCKCPYRRGEIYSWQLRGDDSFVMCKHPEAKDSEGSEGARFMWYKKFKEEALCHFYD